MENFLSDCVELANKSLTKTNKTSAIQKSISAKINKKTKQNDTELKNNRKTQLRNMHKNT